MNSYALVLAGGGAKGAYQLGAWKALREIGITFNAIAGTSIGSINGALIASDDYEKALEMWNNVSVEKGIRLSGELPDSENLFSKKNWGVLFKEFILKGGFDASPTAEFISDYIDEEKIRSRNIPFYIMTVQMTQGVTPREISLAEIPEGELIDYLMASSNIPLATGIGPEGEKFLDGGVYDNVPVMPLKKRGYNKFIVLDISNIKGFAHSMDLLNSQLVYIRPYDAEMLGASFDFDPETNEKRILMGYLDAKKAFSFLLGKIYYFEPDVFRFMANKYGPDTLMHLEELAYALKVEPCRIYDEWEFLQALRAAYETEKSRLEEAAKEETKDSDKEKDKDKEKEKESDFETFRNAIKKRFSHKSPLEEHETAVKVLEELFGEKKPSTELTEITSE